MTIIEPEAFYGDTSLDELVLPNGIKRIEGLAFSTSSLNAINLPASLEYIADNAFDKGVQFDVAEGTYAYTWAEGKGYVGSNVLFLNKEKTVTIKDGERFAILTFNPPETGYYTFYSTGDEGTHARIYDDNHTMDVQSYSSDNNFWLTAQLKKGTTYYLQTNLRSVPTGTFKAHATEAQGLLYVRATGSTYRDVEINEPVTLSVVAQSKEGAVSYQWAKGTRESSGSGYKTVYRDIEGATSSEYTFNASQTAEYRCYAFDIYGHKLAATFSIYVDNQLEMYPEDHEYEFTINYNGSVTLNVVGTCNDGPITYQWSEYTYNEIEQRSYRTPIEGATGTSLTIDHVTSSKQYICVANDAYGNEDSVYFSVNIENHLVASPDEATRKVPVGDTPTLTVNAECDEGNLSYRWEQGKEVKVADHYEYQSTILEDVTGNQYTTEPITGAENYYCTINDDFGNTTSVYFNIRIENHLVASPDEATKKVAPGATTTLKVNAQCDSGEMTYHWTQNKRIQMDDDYEWEYNELSETSSQYTTGPITGREYYYVNIRDEYGNTAYVNFDVDVDNNLQARAVNPEPLISATTTATLEVEATCSQGTLTYAWYDSTNTRVGSNSPTFVVNSVNDYYTYYHCVVTEPYGDSKTVNFTVQRVQNIWSLGNNTVTFPADMSYVTCNFVPEQTGYYIFEAEEYSSNTQRQALNFTYNVFISMIQSERIQWDTEVRNTDHWEGDHIDFTIGTKSDGSFYRKYYDCDFEHNYAFKEYYSHYGCIYMEKGKRYYMSIDSEAGTTLNVNVSYSSVATELPEPNNQFIVK